MAFIDVSVNMSDVSASKVIVMADRLVNLARKSVVSQEDDVFTAKRLRAGRLPSIQSCQSSIFCELLHREEQRSKACEELRVDAAGARPATLKARIGRVFARH